MSESDKLRALRRLLGAVDKVPMFRATDSGMICKACGATGSAPCGEGCWALQLQRTADEVEELWFKVATPASESATTQPEETGAES